MCVCVCVCDYYSPMHIYLSIEIHRLRTLRYLQIYQIKHILFRLERYRILLISLYYQWTNIDTVVQSEDHITRKVLLVPAVKINK